MNANAQQNNHIQQIIITLLYSVRNFNGQLQQLINDILANIINSTENVYRQLRDFWLADYEIDVRSYALARLLSRQNLNSFVNININQNQFIQSQIQLRQYQQINTVSDCYNEQKLAQQLDNDIHAVEIQNYRFMIAYMENLSNNGDFIQQLKTMQLRSNDYNQQFDNKATRNIFSLQSAMKYAGISDYEFMKALVISNIIQQVLIRKRQQGNDEFQQNFAFYVIYIGTILQQLDQTHRIQNLENKGYFNISQRVHLSSKEIATIQQFGYQIADGQTDIDTNFKYIYFVRQPLSRLVNNNRITTNTPVLQDKQLFDDYQQQNLIDNFNKYRLNQIDDIQVSQSQIHVALWGRVYDILADIFIKNFNAFKKQIIDAGRLANVKEVIILLSTVIQIPIVDQWLNNQYNNQQFNQVRNNPQQMINVMQSQNYDNIQGWSKHYTLQFSWSFDGFPKKMQKDLLILEMKQKIIKQFLFFLGKYGANDSADAKIIVQGVVNTMIRKVLFRPIVIYKRPYDNILKVQLQQSLANQYQEINMEIFDNIKMQRQRRQRQDINYLELADVKRKKQKGPNALISLMDYNMEKKFGQMNDAIIFCCQRVMNFILQQLNINEQIIIQDEQQLFQQIDYIEQRYKSIVQFIVDYDQQLDYIQLAHKCEKLRHRNITIIFRSKGHMFPQSLDMVYSIIMKQIIEQRSDDIEDAHVIKQKEVKQRMMYISKELRSHIKQQVCYKKQIMGYLVSYNQRKSCIYFDFETTFDDSNGKLPINDQYIQVEFAYSLVCDIQIHFATIVHSIIMEHNLKNVQVTCNNIEILETKSLFKLNCAKELLQEIQQYQLIISQQIINYQQDIHNILQQIEDEDLFLLIQNMIITNDIIAYSYNGAKFDNHFILDAIKREKEYKGKKWHKCVEFIGTQQDMKILKYENITFADIKLMTAGQSLKQFCKDMNIDQSQQKKDIDISKMKLYSTALINKDEIMSYVLNDSLAIHALHNKFEESIRQLIADYYVKFDDYQMLSQSLKMAHAIETIKSSKDRIKYYLQGYFREWYTISSLSMKVFSSFFVKHNVRATSDDQKLKFMQASYQGGYTQAFVIGQIPDNQEAFYYDYNSMYPAIMAYLNVPSDLDKFEFKNFQMTIHSYEDLNKLGLNGSQNPIQIVNEQFLMNLKFGHYNLFKISKFKFKKSIIAPHFGLRTKLHGTIYPLQYDSDIDGKELISELVLFGFQIVVAMREDQLEMLQIDSVLDVGQQSRLVPLFKEFDKYMYEKRLNEKEKGNKSMAHCIKIFINSLYGKFGEKNHDLDIIMENDEFNNEETFKGIIYEKLIQMKQCKQSEVNENIFNQIKVKNFPLFDINDRDQNLTRVNISNIPMQNTHIGSFVYYASLITAIGRTQITFIANRLKDNARLYYIDTDSIILNKEGARQICENQLADIHSSKLGSLKNEYPIDNDQNKTSIQKLIIFNKKIYQYMINGQWNNKFKGCRNPDDDMLQQFQNGNCRYVQKQQRFKKSNANVIISEFDMTFKLRLSRNIQNLGLLSYTQPFDNLQHLKQYYGDVNNQVIYNKDMQQWIVTQNQKDYFDEI